MTTFYFFLPFGATVGTVGQVLGIVVAETLESAEMGARVVEVKYGAGDPNVVMNISNAIAAKSFYENTRHKVTRGDASLMDELRKAADTAEAQVGDIVKVSGTFHSGAQEHFYLETNSTLVVPSESDTNLTVYCSTQAATKTQKFCASSTGTPAAKVVCRVKRLGGGFGGKETRSVFASCAAAVAAKCTSRPVRLTLARNVDMLTTGQRHAFVTKYHASAKITEDGAKLHSMDIEVYNNGGSALDLSGPVADRALFHCDNVYMFPNLRVEVVACKTAQAPHTAYRGFGGPQGMVIAEHVVEHLAVACGVHIDKMRRDNIYKDGESTHFGMVVGAGGSNGKWNVPKMFDRLHTELDVPKRRAAIDEFNAKNKWLKRGCAILPTKFGIAFTAKYMNQGKLSYRLLASSSYFVNTILTFWQVELSCTSTRMELFLYHMVARRWVKVCTPRFARLRLKHSAYRWKMYMSMIAAQTKLQIRFRRQPVCQLTCTGCAPWMLADRFLAGSPLFERSLVRMPALPK